MVRIPVQSAEISHPDKVDEPDYYEVPETGIFYGIYRSNRNVDIF